MGDIAIEPMPDAEPSGIQGPLVSAKPPVSSQAGITYFLSSLEQATTCLTTELTNQGVILPPPGSAQTIDLDIAIETPVIYQNALSIILLLLAKLTKAQTQVQTASTIAEAQMAVKVAQTQMLAAQYTLSADIATAQATQLEGAMSIVSGICNMAAGIATVVLSVIPVAEISSAVASDAKTATSITEDADSAAEKGAGDGYDADDDEEDEGVNLEAESNPQTNANRANVSQANDTGGAPSSEVKAEERLAKSTAPATPLKPQGKVPEALSNAQKRLNLTTAISGLITSIGNIVSGSMKEAEAALQTFAAGEKASSSYASVVQQLAQTLFQAFGSLLSSITENISKTLSAMEAERRSTTDSQIMKG